MEGEQKTNEAALAGGIIVIGTPDNDSELAGHLTTDLGQIARQKAPTKSVLRVNADFQPSLDYCLSDPILTALAETRSEQLNADHDREQTEYPSQAQRDITAEELLGLAFNAYVAQHGESHVTMGYFHDVVGSLLYCTPRELRAIVKPKKNFDLITPKEITNTTQDVPNYNLLKRAATKRTSSKRDINVVVGFATRHSLNMEQTIDFANQFLTDGKYRAAIHRDYKPKKRRA